MAVGGVSCLFALGPGSKLDTEVCVRLLVKVGDMIRGTGGSSADLSLPCDPVFVSYMCLTFIGKGTGVLIG